jgi:hypothetical protein
MTSPLYMYSARGYNRTRSGEVLELADRRDLGSRALGREGSSPSFPTRIVFANFLPPAPTCLKTKRSCPLLPGLLGLMPGASGQGAPSLWVLRGLLEIRLKCLHEVPEPSNMIESSIAGGSGGQIEKPPGRRPRDQTNGRLPLWSRTAKGSNTHTGFFSPS